MLLFCLWRVWGHFAIGVHYYLLIHLVVERCWHELVWYKNNIRILKNWLYNIDIRIQSFLQLIIHIIFNLLLSWIAIKCKPPRHAKTRRRTRRQAYSWVKIPTFLVSYQPLIFNPNRVQHNRKLILLTLLKLYNTMIPILIDWLLYSERKQM